MSEWVCESERVWGRVSNFLFFVLSSNNAFTAPRSKLCQTLLQPENSWLAGCWESLHITCLWENMMALNVARSISSNENCELWVVSCVCSCEWWVVYDKLSIPYQLMTPDLISLSVTYVVTFFDLTTVVTNSCWSLRSFFRFRVIVGLDRATYLAKVSNPTDINARVANAYTW